MTEAAERKKHSTWGISSFILTFVLGIAVFAVFMGLVSAGVEAVPGLKERLNQAGYVLTDQDMNEVLAVIKGETTLLRALLFIFIGQIAALGMGLYNMFEKDRKKLFGILGIIFSLFGIFVYISIRTAIAGV
ncbi:hypothetical protein ABNB59_07200 [Paenibacillus larvae]|uniref:DUF4064 domain-containing protein n=4 Tax=Paenibacillus larvae TaxID=1464 RepID=V9W7T2_9BACL|nr:hypothetical protein [Paenibacillus larvae]AHD05979.1 hypothetical protein ERIC2_c21860 [Paenibacillus larvae subsp. larvae DSM 25430]AQR76583.1 hypothetical protein BXP28_03470 [Paenibacillus larvae subsp. larvae]AQT83655.1 hypothetical protein B1222_03330 [Paenibacillus larvae subsp. pulvifaciens]AQZ48799.1 hypothetical protein B5S25_21680 [Paenibacillus larvae subsp. pulvifaciens]ARF69901.1 hypothetical protein B7C51_21740 [Paenibacillus larvae subsp. pulvifaciens]